MPNRGVTAGGAIIRISRLLFALALTAIPMAAVGAARVDPAVAGEPLSSRFTVSVDHRNAPVYVAKSRVIAALAAPAVTQSGEAAFTSFDLDAPVTVAVTVAAGVRAAKILPSGSGVVPAVSGNRVTFTVAKPAQLTLEVDGDWMNSLHLFANPVETDVPRAGDPNVIYFGPGVHIIPPLKVGSGKTVYLAGGAVLYGKLGPTDTEGPVIWLDGSNITLRGRGILDGSLETRANRAGNIVKVTGDHIRVEGVVLRDSPNWNLPVVQSRQVAIENVKILGSRDNSDGIDIVNSQQVTVSDGFLRTFDDLVVVKTLFPGAESRDIVVQRMVLWNEIAHALTIGGEIRANVENVRFSDCDIIHDKGREWLLRVFNSDSGTVSHVAWEDIRVEEARRLMSLWIGETKWSQDAERGSIADVTFRDIRSVAPEDAVHGIQFVGADERHGIRGVRVLQVTVGGKPLQANAIERNQFVQGVVVEP